MSAIHPHTPLNLTVVAWVIPPYINECFFTPSSCTETGRGINGDFVVKLLVQLDVSFRVLKAANQDDLIDIINTGKADMSANLMAMFYHPTQKYSIPIFQYRAGLITQLVQPNMFDDFWIVKPFSVNVWISLCAAVAVCSVFVLKTTTGTLRSSTLWTILNSLTQQGFSTVSGKPAYYYLSMGAFALSIKAVCAFYAAVLFRYNCLTQSVPRFSTAEQAFDSLGSGGKLLIAYHSIRSKDECKQRLSRYVSDLRGRNIDLIEGSFHCLHTEDPDYLDETAKMILENPNTFSPGNYFRQRSIVEKNSRLTLIEFAASHSSNYAFMLRNGSDLKLTVLKNRLNRAIQVLVDLEGWTTSYLQSVSQRGKSRNKLDTVQANRHSVIGLEYALPIAISCSGLLGICLIVLLCEKLKID